jgi:antitoxin (DNA-binding transcriptional repressor) of toxin-antitoxin stability system
MQMTLAIESITFSIPELLDRMSPGDEVILTKNQRPVAKLVSGLPLPRQPGTLRGTVVHMAPDFDQPLEDFKEYME